MRISESLSNTERISSKAWHSLRFGLSAIGLCLLLSGEETKPLPLQITTTRPSLELATTGASIVDKAAIHDQRTFQEAREQQQVVQSLDDFKTALANGKSVTLIEGMPGFNEIQEFLHELTDSQGVVQFTQDGDLSSDEIKIDISSLDKSSLYGKIDGKIVGLILDLDCFADKPLQFQPQSVQRWTNANELIAAQGSTVLLLRHNSPDFDAYTIVTYIPLSGDTFDIARGGLKDEDTFVDSGFHGTHSLVATTRSIPLKTKSDTTFVCSPESNVDNNRALLRSLAAQSPKAIVVNRSLHTTHELTKIYADMITAISIDFPEVIIVFLQSAGNDGEEYHFSTNEEIVYVSAIGAGGNLLSYSNRNISNISGSVDNIAAISEYPVNTGNNTSVTYGGTSAASPVVTSSVILGLQNMEHEQLIGEPSMSVVNAILDYIQTHNLHNIPVETLEFPVITSSQIITTTTELSPAQAQAVSVFLTEYNPTIDGKILSISITLSGQVSHRDAYTTWGIDYQNSLPGPIGDITKENNLISWLITNLDAELTIRTTENPGKTISLPFVNGLSEGARARLLQGLQAFKNELPQIPITLTGGEIIKISMRSLTNVPPSWAEHSVHLPIIR